MTPHQIVVVGLRLLSLLWILYLAGQVPMIMVQAIIGPDGLNVGYVAMFFLLNLAICSLLWFFPASVARKLLPSPKDDVVYESPPAPQHWLSLGSTLIGVWVLAVALPDAIYWIVFASRERVEELSSFDAADKAAIVSIVVQLVIGLWLVLGARGVGALVWKIRTGGVSK